MADTRTPGASALVAVDFHGTTLQAVVVDGTPHVALKPIVEALGLQWEAQHKRLARHPVLATSMSVMDMQMQGDDQRRAVTLLPLSLLNGWLFGISANRVRPELKDRLVQYQRECFDVLARHFAGASGSVQPAAGVPALPAPTDAFITDEEAAMLRRLLEDHAQTLPAARRAEFMVRGWSLLKAQFGVSYREIPREQLQTAVEVLGRHINDSHPSVPMPRLRYHDDIGIRAEDAYALANQVGQEVARTVFAAVMNGDEYNPVLNRWLLSVQGDGRNPEVSPIPENNILIALDELPRILTEPGRNPSHNLLADIAHACTQRLARKVTFAQAELKEARGK